MSWFTATSRRQALVVVMLAIVSILTTGLIAINLLARREVEMQAASELPVWYALPAFALMDHEGRPFTLDAMKGKVSLVNFIFTRCQGPCPRITSVMVSLQLTLQKTPVWDRVQLVSVSVDPEYDTPAVLAQYAGWSHAQPGKWFFITGTRADVWRLIVEGFKLPVGEADEDPLMPIFHSQKFALVDAAGRIRGMYDALESDARETMLRDVYALLKEK